MPQSRKDWSKAQNGFRAATAWHKKHLQRLRRVRLLVQFPISSESKHDVRANSNAPMPSQKVTHTNELERPGVREYSYFVYDSEPLKCLLTGITWDSRCGSGLARLHGYTPNLLKQLICS